MLKKIFLTLVMTLLASQAFADDKTYVIATDPNWPPMEYVSSDKEIIGYEIDLVKAAADEMGIKVEFKNVMWDGLFAGLDTERFDAVASTVSITEDRKKTMEFSTPILKFKQAVILAKDKEANSLEDLKGLTLGAQVGTTGLFAIQRVDGVESKSYDDVTMAVEAAYSGRTDGAVCDEPVASNFIFKQKEYADKLKIAFIIEDAEVEECGIAFKKGNTELRDIFNEGLKRVREKGIEAELQKKWFGEVMN